MTYEEFKTRFKLISEIKGKSIQILDHSNWRKLKINNVIIIKDEFYVIDDIIDYNELNKKGKTTGYVFREFYLIPINNPTKTEILEIDEEEGVSIVKEVIPKGKLTFENDGELIIYNDTKYYLFEKCSTLAIRKNTKKTVKVYFDDYKSSSGETLSIEKWDDDIPKAYLSADILEHHIKLFK